MNNRIWIVGCGDIGQRVATLYKSSHADKQLLGIVKSEQSAQICKDYGINIFKSDLDLLDHDLQGIPFPKLSKASLFYFSPPPSIGEEDTRLKLFLKKLAESNCFPKRIVLISTTGVYGDSKGEWIDESTPVNPIADRAKRRLSAENILQNWSKLHPVETMILRVPGIYAEDRLPLARLKKDLAVVNEAEAGFTNRIHADDLACVCKAAMESESLNEIINVTDGNPGTMTAYFNHVADFAHLPRPPQISMQQAEASLSDGMLSYLKESRRIKNEKMLKILKVTLKYPALEVALPLKTV